jgi:hypothetical protein
MYDIAQRQGLRIDLERLSRELDVPVFTTVATRKRGIAELVEGIETAAGPGWSSAGDGWTAPDAEALRGAHRRAEQCHEGQGHHERQARRPGQRCNENAVCSPVGMHERTPEGTHGLTITV